MSFPSLSCRGEDVRPESGDYGLLHDGIIAQVPPTRRAIDKVIRLPVRVCTRHDACAVLHAYWVLVPGR